MSSMRYRTPQNPPPPGEGGVYSSNPNPISNSNNNAYSSTGQPPLAPAVPSANSPGSSSNPSSSSKPPPLSLEQSRQVARTHFDALKNWLTREGALATATTRTNARDKLTRLTRQQFQELSTDVYDELVRRIEDAAGRPGEQPFLAVRPDFHPKRNQARQKLATLPLQRFKDLASDVYFELDRRYPEFGEEDQQRETSRAPSRSDSLSSSHTRHNAPSPTPPPNLNAQRRAPTPNLNGSNPSQQPRSPIDHNPPPLSNLNQTAANNNTGAPTSNDVVVPNKSKMIVEEPSGNFTTQTQLQSPTALSPTSQQPLDHSGQRSSPTDSSRRDELSPLQNQQPNFSTSGSTGGPFRGQHQSRVSEVSSVGTHSKFFGGYAGSATGPPSESGGRRSNELPPWDHEDRQALEKQKSEYEYKLTVLRNRVQELERENEDAAAALRGRSTTDDERFKNMEGQLRGHQQRYEDQTSQLRMVQRDFDNLQQRHEQVQRERDQAQQQHSAALSNGRGVGEDVSQMRQDLAAADDLANELRGEVSSLVDELRQVNERCEDLQLELDKERRDKEEKEREARDWKEKWQAAKTELRNIKATSQLFTSSINVERDFMPASSDGLICDTSIAAFQTSIDDLLESARSKEPSSVISHARQVVSAVEKIDQDVQAISPARYNGLSLQDQDIVSSLKAKINATLSNLMTASKNHATSFGVSPVSLLDAAASHLASTIVELVRILKIRRTSGQPVRSGSLDPSTASSSRFNREPMPPLAEDPSSLSSPSSSSYHRAPSSISSPPAQPKDISSSTSATSSTTVPPTVPKSNGYVTGGVSSLVSSSTAGMRNALEAMGIASSSSAASRSSMDKDRESFQDPPRRYEESVSSPQSDYGQPQGHANYNSFQQPQQLDSSSYEADGDRFNQQGRTNYDGHYEPQYDDHSGHARQDTLQGYDSPGPRSHETNAEELKSYIENQTEAIVHSIQSLLSAIRSGSQGEQLNENLTQIITIVSSIVAISKDALPRGGRAAGEGEAILADLTDHCDKLSEMQSETGGGQAFTKQTKQAMATASFGVAKSLKQLNGLFASAAPGADHSSAEGLV